MINFNIVDNVPEYEFADKSVWDDGRLRSVAKGLLDFLKTHVPAQSAPEEILFDADQALENITFELKMRRQEETVNT